MTDDELQRAAKLTPKEQKAVDDLIAAAKALPRSICVEITDNFQGDGNLLISKRVSRGACQQVATLTKKSLCF